MTSRMTGMKKKDIKSLYAAPKDALTYLLCLRFGKNETSRASRLRCSLPQRETI
jgi:hypothetical protein